MNNDNSEKPRKLLPIMEHTPVPNRLISKDIFKLSAWEIRMILFMLKQVYSVPQKMSFTENEIGSNFITSTRDLSDTLKATPSIVKMTLAALGAFLLKPS